MVEIVIAVFLVSTLHVLSFVVVASLFGVGIKEISFGTGMKLFSYKKIIVRLFQFGGYVSFMDTRAVNLSQIDVNKALNMQPVLTQLAIVLSGVVAVLTFSVVALGENALSSFIIGFDQILSGALSPFTEAQLLISNAEDLANEYSLIYVTAIVGTKLSALNLFPFSIFNGGQALIILSKKAFNNSVLDEKLSQFFLWPGFLIGILWCSAFGYYFYGFI